ncbi:wax ester/triacylglycerol synthase domain-containing protein [Streptomyces sp. NPDC085931]|uniref:wax ester/triacylglycerol synthase domain-containing protein n=1 Tax=Streptomyces sp. NPDC085931 TaxID=3365740 RepID=UPI0037D2196A
MSTPSSAVPGALPLAWPDKYLCLDPDPTQLRFAGALRREGPPPAHEELREMLAGAVGQVPALGYRVTGRGWRRRFEPCPDYDPDDHIEFVRYPCGQEPALCVLDALERPFPHGRSPWSLQVISGYRDTEHLLVYRVCHLLQDGMGASLTAHALLSGNALPPPGPPLPAEPVTAQHLLRGAQFLPRFLQRPARWLPAGRPEPGPALAPVVLDRSAFDDITRSTGAGTAQICLAVLAGALRAWAPHHWDGTAGRRQRRGLPVHMTLDLRGPRERTTLGNHVGIVPLTLPCGEASPTQRLQQTLRQADYGRLGQYRRLLRGFLHGTNGAQWPAAWLCRTLEKPRPLVTMVSTQVDVSRLGAMELLTIPPRPRHVPGGFIFIHQPSTITACAAFHLDHPGTGLLPGLLTDALTELHAATTGHPARGRAARTPTKTS